MDSRPGVPQQRLVAARHEGSGVHHPVLQGVEVPPHLHVHDGLVPHVRPAPAGQRRVPEDRQGQAGHDIHVRAEAGAAGDGAHRQRGGPADFQRPRLQPQRADRLLGLPGRDDVVADRDARGPPGAGLQALRRGHVGRDLRRRAEAGAGGLLRGGRDPADHEGRRRERGREDHDRRVHGVHQGRGGRVARGGGPEDNRQGARVPGAGRGGEQPCERGPRGDAGGVNRGAGSGGDVRDSRPLRGAGDVGVDAAGIAGSDQQGQREEPVVPDSLAAL
mmetsp:Transcript_117545/g.333111  ORF Transcript_117545/g.333111 Transcript_117545/m.333111 type:complete len:275 (-) Transcript_117545:127-951(-)